MTTVYQINGYRNNNYIGGDSMLGRKIDVKVTSAIPYAGLYSGYYMSGTRRKNVFLLSKEHPRDHVRCTVVAIAQSRSGTQVRLIAAPEGQIYYEPLIKKRLKRLRNFRFCSSRTRTAATGRSLRGTLSLAKTSVRRLSARSRRRPTSTS